MAEMHVRPGPSFGGITRIRFKGFDRHFPPIISATRLPRTNFSVRVRPASAKSIRWIEQRLSILQIGAPDARELQVIVASGNDNRRFERSRQLRRLLLWHRQRR